MFMVARSAFALLAFLAGFAICVPAGAFEFLGTQLTGDRPVEREAIDPVPYLVTLRVLSSEPALIDSIGKASVLVAREHTPPSGTVGLLARAREDQEGLLRVLYEAARYGGTVQITIAGRPLGDIDAVDPVPGAGPVPVSITVDPGPSFVFGSVVVAGEDPPADALLIAGRAGLAPGEPARASVVRAAEAALVAVLQRRGHAFAAVSERSLIADHARQALDVHLAVTPGPVARFGPVLVKGNVDVEPAFLARHANIPQGMPFDPQVLEQARQRLARLGALASVTVRTATAPEPDGSVAVVIEVSERKKRTIGAGATVASTTEGAGVEAFWMHRNLFGEAETLRLEGTVERLFEADALDELDARLAIAFTKPGFLDPLVTLDMRTGLLQEDPNPYHRVAAFHESVLKTEITQHLTLCAGIEIDRSRIDDAFGSRRWTTIGLPVIAEHDSRDSLLDPTEGLLARIVAEPFFDAGGRSPFFSAEAEFRAYIRLGTPAFVLALRGTAGAIIGSELPDIPAHRRLYAGGMTSVRGYDLFNIGSRFAGLDATGGLARLEGSAEARLRLTERWSVVPFVDAGFVTAEPDFSGRDDLGIGVGVGLRYHTAAGPFRLDIAFPLDPHRSDPEFAVYVGIGQAF